MKAAAYRAPPPLTPDERALFGATLADRDNDEAREDHAPRATLWDAPIFDWERREAIETDPDAHRDALRNGDL